MTIRGSGGITVSIWANARVPMFEAPPPSDSEVIVIGAGIAGVTCAVELARRGKRVTLIDDGPIGGGETGRTSAHLASAVDDRFCYLERTLGRDKARLVADSHAAAIDYIERVVRERGIDCGFARVDGYLFDPPDAPSGGGIQDELVAAQRAGLVCELVPRTPIEGFGGPALRFANQAQFHPMQYLAGLVEYAVELGVSIHTGVHADGIEPDDSSKERPLRVLLRGHGPIAARHVVDATNCDMSSSFQICLQQAPYRSYVIALAIPRGSVERALYWETGDNYHYIRVADAGGREVLVVGGEDHRVGQSDAGPQFDALEAWAREHVPVAGEVIARWSGQIMEPVDGVAHIGASPALPGVFLCTGDSGNGLTHGTIAGLTIPRLVDGEAVPWSSVYDPARNHAHAGGSYLAEAMRSSAPYLAWIRGGDVRSLDELEPGQGALMRDGLRILACYRNDLGQCHVMSAVCSHLKGIVQWNAAEKTWDCPCHGSRFDAFGSVVNGPALANLEPVETPLADAEPSPGEYEPGSDTQPGHAR
ncbi:MAG: FAD-dependent oxidoreductase [Kofleriaceae bacterium]